MRLKSEGVRVDRVDVHRSVYREATPVSGILGKVETPSPIAALSCDELTPRIPCDSLHKVSMLNDDVEMATWSKPRFHQRSFFRDTMHNSLLVETSQMLTWKSIDPAMTLVPSGDQARS